jgi:hypothetical protein
MFYLGLFCSMWLPLATQGVSRNSFTMEFQIYCVASVTKMYTLVVCTPLSVSVFVTTQ